MLITIPNILLIISAVLSVPKFWSWPSVIVFITMNTGVSFAILWVLTVISLSINFIKDLIYKVLNLGVLSILIAATWTSLSEMLFLYVAYVLAFVGAVVMLFLSVVLMLPRSVISPIQSPKTAETMGILTLAVSVPEGGTAMISLFWLLLVIGLLYC